MIPGYQNFKSLKHITDINTIYEGIGDKSKMLGKGAFGAVYKANRLESSTFYAVKTIEKRGLSSHSMLPSLLCNEL